MKPFRAVVASLGAFATLGILAACAGPDAATQQAEAPLSVTDIKGRTVTLDKMPGRIILGEGRGVFATSILNKDQPVDKVVAMGEDLKTAAPSYFDALVKARPEVQSVPTIGSLSKGDVSVENLLSYQPDLMVLSADNYDALQAIGMPEKMDQAGIKYVVTDFRQHPLTNTTASMDILGTVFGKQEQATKFNTEWTQTVDSVKERAGKIEKKPSVFLWRAAGLKDCCSTVKDSNLGEFVNVAGGDNIGDHILSTESGDVTAEKLIAEQPDMIIATGGSWAKDPKKPAAIPHANLGYATDEATAKDTLNGLTKTPGFEQVTAANEGRLYGVWHQYYDSPLNFLAVEQFAKWQHPEEFADVDVDKHLQSVHEEYLPFAASGTFFSEQR
ncbi:ABC transporter substrate-binding protein [Corynebacterium sp. H128]|uniref:ABC transporter substrate-binding protein n=1 Tax=Corynebacterium sp. H128 TaxID=3133427 RepID=UPI0030B03CF6